jgi:hypothetical protein
MTAIKLARLPDRAPVKITISVSPELHRSLNEYARAYEAAYGEAASAIELIPAMLEAFLASDRGFARSRRESKAQAG